MTECGVKVKIDDGGARESGASFEALSAHLPKALLREVRGITDSYRGESLSELRLRAGGRCSLIIEGRELPLSYRLGMLELSELVSGLCLGGAYAYADGINRGYIPLSCGIRAGVVGRARYEDGRLVGVSEVSSMVLRFPVGRCDFAEELCRIFLDRGRDGMLILSPPAGGKTTALRALAAGLGSGRDALRVVVVDERCEIDTPELCRGTVDVLRGYRRSEGIEVAVRCMSCEVILVDEIGSPEDAEAMERCRGVGVSVVATAHARSIEDALGRKYIGSLIEDGYFPSVVSIKKEGGAFRLVEQRSPCLS